MYSMYVCIYVYIYIYYHDMAYYICISIVQRRPLRSRWRTTAAQATNSNYILVVNSSKVIVYIYIYIVDYVVNNIYIYIVIVCY